MVYRGNVEELAKIDVTGSSTIAPNASRTIQDAQKPPLEARNKGVDGTHPLNKGGRPKGFNGMRSKMPSALAQAFKKAGLDWKVDFAIAIKNNKRERIKLWLKLLPYMITTSSKIKVRSWKGKPSKAAMIALETLEGRDE